MIAAENQIMSVPCPDCGAKAGDRCVKHTIRHDEALFEKGWHIQRRHSAELAFMRDNSEFPEDLQRSLEFYYCSCLITITVSNSSGVSTRTSVTQHRVLARSDEEARGLAFEQAKKLRPEHAVDTIIVMRHSDDGATLASTTKPKGA